jgi:V8-like Glu-specific endopeptidase
VAEYPHAALIPLRTILANLYPTAADARLIAKDAGLEPAQIALSDKSVTTWFNILQNANGRKKVDAVIARALEDYPENEQLQQARAGAPPPIVEGPEPPQWNGPARAPQLEKIMGATSTLVPITYLEVGVLRARSVVRIKRQDNSSGSGFLTDGKTIVTNNHVLPDAETARNAVVQFNYQQTAAGTNADIAEFKLLPDAFSRTSKPDDWTAVRIDADPAATWGALPLQPTQVKAGDHVNIIQHPGGGPKQISLLANVVVFVGGGRVQYLTDTLPGSSGSPVFDAQWNIVALHHSGGWLTEPNAASKSTYYRNEGISIDKVIEGLG